MKYKSPIKNDNVNSIDKLLEQYVDFKFSINEKYKNGCLETFNDIVLYALKDKDFKELSVFYDICMFYIPSIQLRT